MQVIKITPVPISDHASLLGEHFAYKFAVEMQSYYKPFVLKNRSVQLAKETWEYAVADAVPDAEWIGAGKNIIDVLTPKIQIDVKGISCENLTGKTTEASILQNNKMENDNVLSLFENKDIDALKKMFIDPYVDKVSAADNLHILAAVRIKKTKEVYYCLLKVDIIENETFMDSVELQGRRSVLMPMIDPKYGNTCLYLPKRRLEMRLDMRGLREFCVYSHNYSINSLQLNFDQ